MFFSNYASIYIKTEIMENNQKQYKRQDRSVSPETAQKISNSLKRYNQNHPRGTAADGSQWSQRISDAMKAETGGYWSHIPKKDNGKVKMSDLVM